MHDLSPIIELALSQHGVIHREQVRSLGYPPEQLTRWVRAGRLRRVGPNTFTFIGCPTTWEKSLTIGLLELGPSARVARRSAAALFGFDGYTEGPLEFVVPRPRRQRLTGFRIYTTTTLHRVDAANVRGFPCTGAARTIIDLAAAASTRELADAIDSALRDGLVSEAYLRRRIDALRGRGRRGLRRLADALEDAGGHSPLERRFLALLRRANLPRPRCQVVHRAGTRFVARTDFFWELQRVVVEVAGQGRHASPGERQRDAERQGGLQLLGYLVLTLTYEDVVERPDWVIARVREALSLHSPS